MASRTFNADSFFARKAKNLKTPVTMAGYRTILNGIPKSGTVEGLAQQAQSQLDTLRVSKPRTTLADGSVSFTVRGEMSGKDVAEFIRGAATIPAADETETTQERTGAVVA